MKALALIAAAVAIPTTPFYDGMPPARFQGPAKLKIVFGHVDKCGIAHEPGRDVPFEACVRSNVTYLPDPCAYPQETFARLTCHEIGHHLGWPADHGE